MTPKPTGSSPPKEEPLSLFEIPAEVPVVAEEPVELPATPEPFVKAQGAHHADDDESWAPGEVARTLNGMGQAGTNGAVAASASGVRRLTPTECERLQGFPDGWTIPTGPPLR